MTHPYYLHPRVTSATKKRQANVATMIGEIIKHELDSYQISELLGIGASGARKYITIAMDAGAIKVAKLPSKAERHSTVYCVANAERARALMDPQTDLGYVPKPRNNANKKLLAEAAKQGRRLVHKGDGDYLKLPPVRPAFRCEFETIFFGPAKATA